MISSRPFLTAAAIIFVAVSFAHAVPKSPLSPECIGHCANDGICRMIRDTPTCYCLPGWQGQRCEEERPYSLTQPEVYGELVKRQPRFDLCSAVPGLCKNGGLCQVNGTLLWCACPTTFIGKYCETTSPCVGLCFNGGLCSIKNGIDAECNCNGTGFAGTRCLSPTTTDPASTTTTTPHPACVSLAASGICVNGTCQLVGEQARCQCTTGTSGPFCVTGPLTPTPPPPTPSSTGPGLPSPSPTGPATPSSSPGPILPQTTSSQGSGTRQPGNCSGNPCRNSRPCFNNGDSYYCYCGTAYAGVNCEISLGK